jgi:hypothetical protein
MIFISYSHADDDWRKRFAVVSKPLSEAHKFTFWSDQDINAGKWEDQISKAIEGAEAAVLLVSDAFAASDYIMKKELPYLLKAHKERGLMIFWLYLEPCLLQYLPGITDFQAMTTGGNLKPLSSMTDWEWKSVMVAGCGMIDDYFKEKETPDIDPSVNGQALEKRTTNFTLLATPAQRFVEVLVYSSDKKWWTQWGVKAGSRTTTIQLGNDKTSTGTEFKVVALTTDTKLREDTYLNIPDHRTRSAEITLYRK